MCPHNHWQTLTHSFNTYSNSDANITFDNQSECSQTSTLIAIKTPHLESRQLWSESCGLSVVSHRILKSELIKVVFMTQMSDKPIGYHFLIAKVKVKDCVHKTFFFFFLINFKNNSSFECS